MNVRMFDGWVRRLATPAPRRSVLWMVGGMLSTALALARGQTTQAGAGCKKLNRHCRKNRQCCTGHCRRRRCRR